MGKSIITGVIAGLVGAGVWAAISHFGNVEIGWIAIGIGAFVGFAVGASAAHEASAATGAIAVVIAVLSIVGGKWAAVELDAREAFAKGMELVDFTDETFIVQFADETYFEWQDAGRNVQFPRGSDIDSASSEEEYPQELWREAEARWDALGPDGQEQMREDLDSEVKGAFRAEIKSRKMDAFKASFGLLDILFFGLAIVAAFKLGSGIDTQ